MEKVFQIGEHTIFYQRRRSRRARRIIIRIESGGQVTLTVPWYVSYRQGEKFLQQRLSWVRRMQAKQRGKWGERSSLPDEIKKPLVAEYTGQAREYFEAVVRELALALGVVVPGVRIANFRSQWGNCNRAKGEVAFSWRLMLVPDWVARYVAAHEVAHLVHANHSRKFWQIVERVYPQYREARRYLRRQGQMSLLP